MPGAADAQTSSHRSQRRRDQPNSCGPGSASRRGPRAARGCGRSRPAGRRSLMHQGRVPGPAAPRAPRVSDPRRPPHHTSRGKHAHHGGEPVAMSHPAPSVPEAPAARRQGRWLYTTPRRWLGGIFASASRIGGEVSVPGGSGQPSCCVVGDAAPLAPTLGDGLPGHRRRSPSQGPGPMTSMVTVHETAGPFSLEAPWRRPVVGGIPGRTTACRTHQPTVPVPDAAR